MKLICLTLQECFLNYFVFNLGGAVLIQDSFGLVENYLIPQIYTTKWLNLNNPR